MGIFRRKKEVPEEKVSYVDWEKEVGFLDILIAREINIARNIFVDLQKADNQSRVDDDRIADVVNTSVGDIVSTLSPKYVDFLSDKYFNGREALIEYIINTLYVTLMSDVLDIHNRRHIELAARERAGMITRQLEKINEENKED